MSEEGERDGKGGARRSRSVRDALAYEQQLKMLRAPKKKSSKLAESVIVRRGTSRVRVKDKKGEEEEES